MRFYFDTNATSPLAGIVTEALAKGDFIFANPSSLHQEGKRARKLINEVRGYLYQLFSLNPKEFDLVFHSGSTEGLSSLILGFALSDSANKVWIAQTDHSCVYSLKDSSLLKNEQVHLFAVDHGGQFNRKALRENLSKVTPGESLLHYTAVNSETGVVWDLPAAVRLKKDTGVSVVVDAAQWIGKVPDWKKLDPHLDAYVFSGHKIGALPGVGFSFIKKFFSYLPLFQCGGQQEGLRG
ncbi:MAG: aminotransferase class V-fold PLP-dependent enzyme, partial [Pseudomonadota bacterium]